MGKSERTNKLRAPAKGRPAYRVSPLTPSRWANFEQLFGRHGASGGCWCMWWRQTAREFNAKKGEANRRAMRALVHAGRVPGLIAYEDNEPVGWVSVAPREEFPRLKGSRILKPVDEKPVWSVVCFFVARPHRGKGIAKRLLEAAVDYAGSHDAKIVEGYAVEPAAGRAPDLFIYHGPAALFRSVGFKEVARRSETRPIMRYSTRRRA
ncbi:MAG: GNAT family N-acetyltransferase [Candidatus Eisenbacteria bacterium]|nr:GNAT family N-acetyltransferase [Candidatus Eisenbacteria bacterium]